jgi:cytochrome P450
MSAAIPRYEPNIFSDDGILNPYPYYTEMRRLGPIVYMSDTDCYAVTRFDGCHAILNDPQHFISGKGVAINDLMNDAVTTSIITSDGLRHDFMRKIEREPLSAKALNALRARIFGEADTLVDELLAKGDIWHDAVADIGRHLPLTVVMEIGGLPPVGRAEMLRWAAAIFDLQGPMNARGEAALPALREVLSYISKDIDRHSVAPGSWAARAFRLADDGVIPPEMVGDLLGDFIGPSLDTTIAGTGNLLMLFGQNPEQWQRLKQDRRKIPNAINEALRLESPIRCFARLAPQQIKVGGITLPAQSRVIVLFASGNRDDVKFAKPERFDITRRNASEHLAFGGGIHHCIGNNLARLEMTAILNALLDKIDTFEVGEPAFAPNNLLRTLQRLPIRLQPLSH